jgi:hypothetical protein
MMMTSFGGVLAAAVLAIAAGEPVCMAHAFVGNYVSM